MNKRILLLVCSAVIPIAAALSQPRTYQEARTIAARRLLCKVSETTRVDLAGGDASKHGAFRLGKSDKPPFYIFNGKDSSSFVIISGDSRMKPVLGICDRICFGRKSIPCGLAAVLSHYAEQYESLNATDTADSSSPQLLASPTVPDVSPMLTTAWGQGSPYNDDVPEGLASGCVATAMAQIMKYYQYPSTGQGSFSYITQTRKLRLYYDFANTNFAWTEMADRYSQHAFLDNVARKAVANLMKACGVAVGMDYGCDGEQSGAYEIDIAYALINFFAYNKSVALYERDFFSSDEWYAKIIEELENGRPVLYCGVDARPQQEGGHAFVIDGCRKSDGKFHVNWGWDGAYDGYYELDALESAQGRFSTHQCMIVRFCPQSTHRVEDTFYAETFTCSEKRVATDITMGFSLKNAVNYSNSSSYKVLKSSFSGVIGVGLYDAHFNFIKSLDEKPITDVRTASSPASTMQFTAYVEADSLDDTAVYYIAPYARSLTAEHPTRIRTTDGRTDYYAIRTYGGEDNPEDYSGDNTQTLLVEGFENSELPEGWNQVYIQGSGNWEVLKVLFGDDNSETPNSAAGHGYLRLKYNSGSLLGNERTVTRIVLPTLHGEPQQQYTLQFLLRKHSSAVSNSEVVSVMIDKACDGNWELLAEKSVTNSSTWQLVEVPFLADGAFRISIEGSLERGSSLFIDEVEVNKATMTVINPLTATHSGEYRLNDLQEYPYSISGQRLDVPHKGINILDGKKIVVK